MTNPRQMALDALILSRAGKVREAEVKLRELLQHSQMPTVRILLASLLPPIYQSMDDLRQWRTRLETGVRELVAAGVKEDLLSNAAVPEFLAQYHGLNDRTLQEMRGKLYTAPQADAWGAKQPRGADGKIRVGFISKFFREHTIGRLNLGLIANLPRNEFNVSVITLAGAKDAMAEQFRKCADQYIAFPELVNELPNMRRAIRDLKLHAIIYADLGMDPMTYTLAQSRLAAVQCVTWGHPVTTGLPSMDYFISAEGLEPEESQDQYTEKIVKLPDLAVHYERPKLDGPIGGRERLGLPPETHLYGCLQSLYKFHPEFDEILTGILRADPNGVLLLLSGQSKEWNLWLLQRLARSFPDAPRRVLFVGRQNNQGFLRLSALCDVLLDPIHFGGGNTTYEALALGVPVVTWPSNMLRGRLAYKMYLAMGWTDLVARDKNDFVRLALEIANNPDRRRQVSQSILDRCGVLFNNNAGVKQLGAFLQSVVS